MADNPTPRAAILMAGGAGRRLWPVSGPDRPKPLFRLPGHAESLLEETAAHGCGLPGEGAWATPSIHVATSAPFADAVRSAVPELPLLVEPLRRNTSGCVVLGLATLLSRGADPGAVTVGFLNTDALVTDAEAYRATIRSAYQAAEEHDTLVCVGFRPTRAETGFGYIEVGATTGGATVAVRRFREKPDVETAEAYVAGGRHWWNSGMLFGTAWAFLRAMERHNAPLARSVEDLARALAAGDEPTARGVFAAVPDLSVDYALLERCDDLLIVAGDLEWDTLDGWDSVYRALAKDDHGNVVVGDCTVENCSGCLVYRDGIPGAPPVVAVGLRDMAVVSGSAGLLTAPLSRVRAEALRRAAD